MRMGSSEDSSAPPNKEQESISSKWILFSFWHISVCLFSIKTKMLHLQKRLRKQQAEERLFRIIIMFYNKINNIKTRISFFRERG